MTINENDKIITLTGIKKGEWIRFPELHSISVRTAGMQVHSSSNQMIKITDHGVFLKYMNEKLTGTLFNYPKKKSDSSFNYFTLQRYKNKELVGKPEIGDTIIFYRNRRIILQTTIKEIDDRLITVEGLIPDNFDHVGIYKPSSEYVNEYGPFVISLEDRSDYPFEQFISLTNIQGYHFR